MTVHIDFETRSPLSLRDVGAFRYLQHPKSAVLCMGYSLDGAEPTLWHPTFPLIPEDLMFPMTSYLKGSPLPQDLFERIRAGDELSAHNAAFERAVFEIICGPRLGWPVPLPGQWHCTLAECAATAIPLSLDGAAFVLGLRLRKDPEGRRVMQKLTTPRKPTKKDSSLWYEDVVDLKKLFEYCKQDVRVEVALAEKLPRLTELERRVFHIDQKINFRGVRVDIALCREADKAGKERAARLAGETSRLTGGVVDNFTKVGAARAWLAARGVQLPDLRKETVRDALAGDELADPAARRFLEIRAAGGKTSVAKYRKLLELSCADERYRGAYQYHGAFTGRWAGRGGQLHNMPKGASEAEQRAVIDALMAGGVDLLEMLYDQPIDELSRVIRGALIPAPGCKFVAGDFSAVEARGVLWLADQDDILELYRQGEDLYCWMAGHIFGRDPADIRRGYLAGDTICIFQRFVGKQTTLGCGYGMGDERFVTYCAQMGTEITRSLAEVAVQTYRDRAPNVKRLWSWLNAAVVKAITSASSQPVPKVFKACGGRVEWFMDGSFLRCKLPSGRCISYFGPSVHEVTARDPKSGKEWRSKRISYKTVESGRWGYTRTFGGKLLENVCQAITRDLLAMAMINCEAAGFPVVMHSHDEIVCEVPEEMPNAAMRLESLMEIPPSWADGFPIKTEAWEGHRYRK